MKNKINIIIVLLIILVILSSCNKDYMQRKYQQLNDSNHIFKVCCADEIIELLDSNKKAIIVFSFPACPWCQAAIPYINEVAKEMNYNEIYYLDIKDMRDNSKSKDHKKYIEIYEKIRFDITNPDNINAPTVIVINNGNVLGFHTDTVESHIKNENNVLDPMNDNQINELKEIYRKLFSLN